MTGWKQARANAEPSGGMLPPLVPAEARNLMEEGKRGGGDGKWGGVTHKDWEEVQGYHAYKKPHPSRTLLQAYAWGPRRVIGGWAFFCG